jgi:hypothetical protein
VHRKWRVEWLGKAVAVNVAEVQNIVNHVLRIKLVLQLSGQHLNRPFNLGEVNRQSEMAKLTKSRDSLQPCHRALAQYGAGVLLYALSWVDACLTPPSHCLRTFGRTFELRC